LIVPVVGNPNQYYIFSNDDFSIGNTAYSKVDMTLNSGFGDVITPSGIDMGNGFGEKMITVPGNNCNLWLVIRRLFLGEFWVYNIDAAGIHPPTVYACGHFTQSAGGVIKASPNRLKIVEQNCMSWGGEGTELFDFDPATGAVSNGRVIDSFGYNYGAEFSPDNTKLYSAPLGGYVLHQYDVSLPTTAAIIASKTLIGTPTSYGDLKLGPDNKIYFGSGAYLGCIPNPNAAGVACGHIQFDVPLLTGTSTIYGLPNTFHNVVLTDSAFERHDTGVCMAVGGTVAISAHDPLMGSVYIWNDGTTSSSRNVAAAGTYWVYISNGCSITVDTIRVIVDRQVGAINGTTHLCMGQTSMLTDTTLSGIWSSSNTAVAPISVSGLVTSVLAGTSVISYYVPASGCLATTTVVVDTMPRTDTVTGGGMRCEIGPGLPVYLSGSVSTITYQLYNGATAVGAPMSGTGAALSFGLQTFAGGYYVVATDPATGCAPTMADTAFIAVTESAVIRNIDTTLCVTSDTVSVTLSAPTATSYTWYDGSTASTHFVNTEGTYWVNYTSPCVNTDSFHVIIMHPPCGVSVPGIPVLRPELFPNPAYSSLNIKDAPGRYSQVEVRNAMGQVVLRQGLTSPLTTIDIAALPMGVYFVTLQGSAGSRVLKFVKI
jgi:hypothetical protein